PAGSEPAHDLVAALKDRPNRQEGKARRAIHSCQSESRSFATGRRARGAPPAHTCAAAGRRGVGGVGSAAPVVTSLPSSSALELAVYTGGAVEVHALPVGGVVTLGRDAASDVRIDGPTVSRRHAILHLGSPLRIEDLGSKSGTYVDAASSLHHA